VHAVALSARMVARVIERIEISEWWRGEIPKGGPATLLRWAIAYRSVAIHP